MDSSCALRTLVRSAKGAPLSMLKGEREGKCFRSEWGRKYRNGLCVCVWCVCVFLYFKYWWCQGDQTDGGTADEQGAGAAPLTTQRTKEKKKQRSRG